MVDLIFVVNINMGMLVGFYVNVVKMMDDIVMVLGIEGILLIFDDFFFGIENFG